MIGIIVLFFSSIVFSQEIALQRPEPSKIMSIIEEINLSEKQKEAIEEELIMNLKKYDKIRKKYEKKLKEKEELEKEIESLKNNMVELNKNVTVIVKSFLNDEQKLKFADIVKKQKEKIKKEEKKEDAVETTEKSKDNSYNEKTSPFDIYFP